MVAKEDVIGVLAIPVREEQEPVWISLKEAVAKEGKECVIVKNVLFPNKWFDAVMACDDEVLYEIQRYL